MKWILFLLDILRYRNYRRDGFGAVVIEKHIGEIVWERAENGRVVRFETFGIGSLNETGNIKVW